MWLISMADMDSDQVDGFFRSAGVVLNKGIYGRWGRLHAAECMREASWKEASWRPCMKGIRSFSISNRLWKEGDGLLMVPSHNCIVIWYN